LRRTFVEELFKIIENDKNVVVLLGDLGYGIFDEIREKFPEQCLNVGASEQLMLGMSVGIALQGKIPICYSITPFMLYRPFEFIRNYMQEEKIPVKLVGSGRGKDYLDAGFTHFSEEAEPILKALPNIKAYFPKENIELKSIINEFVYSLSPAFLSLRK
jgi:transketolase